MNRSGKTATKNDQQISVIQTYYSHQMIFAITNDLCNDGEINI